MAGGGRSRGRGALAPDRPPVWAAAAWEALVMPRVRMTMVVEIHGPWSLDRAQGALPWKASS